MYKKNINHLINLLFPPSCTACKQILVYGEKHLCTNCLATLPHTSQTWINPSQNLVAEKFYGKIPIENATSLFKFTKKSPIQTLLHQLKYNNKRKVIQVVGRYYGLLLKKYQCHTTCELIIPVPLHAKRLRERGYNQSLLLAKVLADVLKLPCYQNWLLRKHYSPTQTKKNRMSRWDSVAGVFSLSEEANVKGKHILLVDDLITTGATLTACASTLLRSGAKKISIACLALVTY